MDEMLEKEIDTIRSEDIPEHAEAKTNDVEGELADDQLEAVSGGMRKAGGDPRVAGKTDIIAI